MIGLGGEARPEPEAGLEVERLDVCLSQPGCGRPGPKRSERLVVACGRHECCVVPYRGVEAARTTRRGSPYLFPEPK